MIYFENIVINLDEKGARHLCVNATFSIGDFVLIVGPNGSGKTSFLDLVSGVRKPFKGSIKGISPDQPIAYAVQDSQGSLLPWLSIISNILLPSRLTLVENDQKNEARELLERFGLLHRANDFPYCLSGGEKQAINFIRTICTPASIRLFDEVTASLHSSFKHVAREVLPITLESTVTFIVSHDRSDLILPFNRYLVIKGDMAVEVLKSEAEEIMCHV